MPKELSAGHEPQSCDICGRTMLKGERPEAYLVRDGGRRLVCELCHRRAEQAGWIRESAHHDLPAAHPEPERRPSLLARLRRRGDVEAQGTPAEDASGAGSPPLEQSVKGELAPTSEAYEGHAPVATAPTHQPYAEGPRDPRHVRAVPTNAQVKIDRALELFNESEHPRTVAGLLRTLGEPWVSALPILEAPSEVTIVVAWELSWYQYRVDLADIDDPVILIAKGEELGELDEGLEEWNASALADGTLTTGVAAES